MRRLMTNALIVCALVLAIPLAVVGWCLQIIALIPIEVWNYYDRRNK